MAETHCGHVAIIGRPNAGKSTLLNALLSTHASIVTPKPHTTRQAIRAVLTKPPYQAIFIDTPGINPQGNRLLHRSMNKAVSLSSESADVIVWLVVPKLWGLEEQWLLESLPKDKPIILAINKVDKFKDKDQILPIVDQLKDLHPFHAIYGISAKEKERLDALLTGIFEALPTAPFKYDEETSHLESEFVRWSECIRKPLLNHLSQELPYQSKVSVDHHQKKGKCHHIHATIWVERAGQKNIVIGKKGQMIKTIGAEARQHLETLTGDKVNLKLWVRVQEDWSDDPNHLV